MNTAADFLSGLEMDSNEKKFLKIREEIPAEPIVVNIESTGIAQEELVFFDITDQHETTEKELSKRTEMLYLTIHQSSQCRVIMQMTCTKTQQK